MVSFELTEQQAEVVGAAAEHGMLFNEHAMAADRQRRIQPQVFEVIKAEYLDLRIPREYGGKGVDAVTYGSVIQKLAHGDAAATLDITMHTFAVNVLSLPGVPGDVKECYFEVARNSLLCAAISEPGASAHDARSFIPQKVIATPLPDGGYEIWGSKSVVTGCDLASHVMVFARKKGTMQVICAMVRMDDENLSVGDAWNNSNILTSTNSHPIEFRGARVGPEDVVMEMDDFLGTVMMQEGAITFASIAVYAGVFRRLWDIAMAVVKTRVPNGSAAPLSHLPHIASSVLVHSAKLRSAEHALLRSFWSYDQRCDEVTTMAAFTAMCEAKAAVSSLAESVPSLTELVGQTAQRDPFFELGVREMGAANYMPPNTPTALRLGGYVLLGVNPASL